MNPAQFGGRKSSDMTRSFRASAQLWRQTRAQKERPSARRESRKRSWSSSLMTALPDVPGAVLTGAVLTASSDLSEEGDLLPFLSWLFYGQPRAELNG